MRGYGWVGAALIFGVAAPLAAQTGADRLFADSILSSIASATTAAAVPLATRCVGHPAPIARLCDGLLATRRAELDTNKKDATHAREVLERLVGEQSGWPLAWYALGVARLQATRAGAGTHTGPLQPSSASNESGAAAAFLKALQVDSSFTWAAEALALAPIPHDNPAQLAGRVAVLRRVRRLLPPAALYGEALVEREAGHFDSALALWDTLLVKGGVDPGVVELAMSRDLFALKRVDEATQHLFSGADDSTVASRYAYRRELVLVATPAELAQWDSTASSSRPGWLRRFWALRDVHEGRPAGSRLAEHYLRMEEATAWFRFTCPQDCGLALHPIMGAVDDYLDVVATASTAPFQHVRSAWDVLDDRGLVYVRQGGPDIAAMRTTEPPGYELWGYHRPGTDLYLSFSPQLPTERPYELQSYPAYQLAQLKDSAGEAVPAWFVPTVGLPGHPQYGTYFQQDFCALERSLCVAKIDTAAATNPRINCSLANPEFAFVWNDPKLAPADADPRLAAEILRSQYSAPPRDAPYIYFRERAQGLWAIQLATTTDAFPLPLKQLLSPALEVHVLAHARTGAQRVVIAYAIPAEQLARDAAAAVAGKVMYPVRLHVIAYRVSDGERIDMDTLRRFTPATVLNAGEFVTGQVEVALPPGTYVLTLVVTQSDNRGAVVHLDNVTVPGRASELRVSDLIVGRPGSGVTWNSDSTVVSLDPVHLYPKGSDATVYFQLSGLVAGESYVTSFEFFHEGDDSTRGPRLALSFTQLAAGARAEVARALGLQALDLGTYRVRLMVRGGGKEVAATGCLTVVK